MGADEGGSGFSGWEDEQDERREMSADGGEKTRVSGLLLRQQFI